MEEGSAVEAGGVSGVKTVVVMRGFRNSKNCLMRKSVRRILW